MGDTKHTPGEWTLGGENNEAAEVCMGDVAVSLDRYSRDPGRCGVLAIDRDEMLANARLIAAAPELLEALQGLIDAVQCCDPDDGGCEIDDPRKCPWCRARAAIEKARGGR